MTTPINLVDELVKFIEGVVKEYDLTTKIKGENKAPSVYAGYLPPEDDDGEERLTPQDYPFVIARFVSNTDDFSNGDSVNIRLVIGTYSEDEQNGWRDTLNIATRIKIELKKKQILGAFALTNQIQVELFEEQLVPFWHAIMDLSFNEPQVQSETGFDYDN
ncbi:hypothetical protein [Cytobacillus sp. IB215665]|uniref:hypothetical protein n=1 Tax=Cytobacillus sp. IB215665 TaxID=3097357 RepID=UPI002A0DBECA|nr:hypothetical protein [Cytobacillus sp. IB215665]MDX8367780.1 hypothetical protein [Cytobacillus sp. IB215665]